MKFKNANKLARSKIKRYRCRTFLILIPISLFFGVIMSLLLILSSLKTTAFRAASQIDTKVYLNIAVDASELNILRQRVESVGGELMAEQSRQAHTTGTWLSKDGTFQQVYNDLYGLILYPQTIVQKYITENYKQTEVPILVNLETAANLADFRFDTNDSSLIAEVYKRAVGLQFSLNVCEIAYDEYGVPKDLDSDEGLDCFDTIDYKIVGIIPSFRAIAASGQDDSSADFFKIVLNGMSNSDESVVLTAQTVAFKQKYMLPEDETIDAVAKFDSYDAVVEFQEKYSCRSVNKTCLVYKNVSEILGNRLDATDAIDSTMNICFGAIIILAIVAMIAFVVNIVKILDDEEPLINLYKILGASGSDLLQVYFLYVLKVLAYTMLLSVVISLIIAAIVFTLGSATLLTGFSFMYSSSVSPELISGISYAADWRYFGIMASIALSGLISFLFSIRKLHKIKN